MTKFEIINNNEEKFENCSAQVSSLTRVHETCADCESLFGR